MSLVLEMSPDTPKKEPHHEGEALLSRYGSIRPHSALVERQPLFAKEHKRGLWYEGVNYAEDPVITKGAGDDMHVLVIYRPKDNTYAFPGGMVEKAPEQKHGDAVRPDGTIGFTALKELYEESLDIVDPTDLPIVMNIIREKLQNDRYLDQDALDQVHDRLELAFDERDDSGEYVGKIMNSLRITQKLLDPAQREILYNGISVHDPRNEIEPQNGEPIEDFDSSYIVTTATHIHLTDTEAAQLPLKERDDEEGESSARNAQWLPLKDLLSGEYPMFASHADVLSLIHPDETLVPEGYPTKERLENLKAEHNERLTAAIEAQEAESDVHAS